MNIFDHKEDNFTIILSRISDLNDTKFSFFKALMTAHWVPERLFWPYIQSLDPLRPNFGKNSANIFDHRTLSNGTLGFGATFLALH